MTTFTEWVAHYSIRPIDGKFVVFDQHGKRLTTKQTNREAYIACIHYAFAARKRFEKERDCGKD
jgi:hypothetical protein